MNLLWITIEGIPRPEILEGLGYTITAKGNVMLNGVLQITGDGSLIEVKDVLAIVSGTEKGTIRLITDVSELEEDED